MKGTGLTEQSRLLSFCLTEMDDIAYCTSVRACLVLFYFACARNQKIDTAEQNNDVKTGWDLIREIQKVLRAMGRDPLLKRDKLNA